MLLTRFTHKILPRRGWSRAVLVAGAAACLTVAGTLTPAWGAGGGASSYDVIATGLNNPRGIAVSPHALYVAESGIGSSAGCAQDAPGGLINSEGTFVCAGTTGSVAEVTYRRGWRQSEVVTGLPSLAGADGSSATGPSGIIVNGHGRYVLTVGLGLGCGTEAGPTGPAPTGPDPDCSPRADNHLSGLFGTVIEGSLHNRHVKKVADVSAHEWATNPVDNPDSNPAGIAFARGRYAVADAGGNTLVEIRANGRARTIATFPDQLVPAPGGTGTMPMQQVPTAVVWHDGAYYVGTLTGFPFPVGGARVYRVVPGHAPQLYASGLTNVTGLAFGPRGMLYAVQIATNGLQAGPVGSVVAISHRGRSITTVADNLFAPYGIAISGHALYVTTGSVLPGAATNPTPTTRCAPAPFCTGGEVVRIPIRG